MTTVGVIGAGAMGMGVVRSLRRAGFATLVRDVRAEAERDAARLGAAIAADAAAVAAACDIAVVLVVDAAQVDDVLFGPAGMPPARGMVRSSCCHRRSRPISSPPWRRGSRRAASRSWTRPSRAAPPAPTRAR